LKAFCLARLTNRLTVVGDALKSARVLLPSSACEASPSTAPSRTRVNLSTEGFHWRGIASAAQKLADAAESDAQ
jgi:hypothetical protein